MKLFNNTPGDVFFGIESTTSADCGTIDAGATSDWPAYDNSDNVTVSFAALPVSTPPDITPFKITIPDSGTGMAITIGIYKE
jgi:hypothetical protein